MRYRQIAVYGPRPLPTFIFVAGIIYYSVGYTVYISTLDWDGLSPRAVALGLGNYTAMLRDPIFWSALEHTAVFWVVMFVIQTVLGFTLAVIMHSTVRLKTLHKAPLNFPVLLIGAANVNQGVFEPFIGTPRHPPLLDQVVASTALPRRFRQSLRLPRRP